MPLLSWIAVNERLWHCAISTGAANADLYARGLVAGNIKMDIPASAQRPRSVSLTEQTLLGRMRPIPKMTSPRWRTSKASAMLHGASAERQPFRNAPTTRSRKSVRWASPAPQSYQQNHLRHIQT